MIVDDSEQNFWKFAAIEPCQSVFKASGDSLCILTKGAASPRREDDVGTFCPLHFYDIEQVVDESLGICANGETSMCDLLGCCCDDTDSKPFVYVESFIVAGALEDYDLLVH